MKFRIALLTFLLALSTPPANAAVKVQASKPAITVISPSGSGDQISDFTVNTTAIAIVGTVESGLANLVTTPNLGGSDGFISILDKNKVRIWDLRLGTSSDDIATAIAKDKSGYFWVVGSTSKPVDTVTAMVDSTALNLDNVLVDPVMIPTNSLTRLVLWKVGISGELAATYYYDTEGLVLPSTISFDGTNLNIIGNLTSAGTTKQFSIKVDQSGIFSEFAPAKSVTPKATGIETIKAGANNLKSFISKTTIIGIPSWRAKAPTPVIVKYTKAGKALAANSFIGKVRKIVWQSGIGAIVLVETKSDNEIHFLVNMA